jgi:LacI family transcriptional regulator
VGIIAAVNRPTIMDVARLCGVSKTTVSVILNDSPAGARVPEDTRSRVRDAALKLGYSPNWRARALASRRTHMVGVLYAPPMPLVVRGNYEGIMQGIHEVLGARHYHLLFVPLGENPAEWGKILLDQRMDGALVLSRLREPLAEALQQSRLPVTLVNADTDQDVPIVVADDYGGARDSTQHLLSLGHERIAFLLGDQPPHHSVTQRTAGYRDAMNGAGLGQQVRIVNGEHGAAPAGGAPLDSIHQALSAKSVGAIDALVRELAGADPATRPTAVIAYTHYLAIRLLQRAWESGLRVPDDLSVTAFTNVFPVEDVIPPLTTVALPTEQMGRTAAEMVLEQIETGGEAPKRRVVLKETLVVRKSTAPPRR